MVIQHNLQAMNANRMLNVTSASQGKSTEKLSSGYRINRAADDAAGLAISEKMRKQVRGLENFATFTALYTRYGGVQVGSVPDDSVAKMVADTYTIYTPEQEREFGVLAIHIGG